MAEGMVWRWRGASGGGEYDGGKYGGGKYGGGGESSGGGEYGLLSSECSLPPCRPTQ